jgi:hypothetical protein
VIKKMLSILVILSLIGFSTAYAYDRENDDQAAGLAIFGVLAVATAAILLSSHDTHGEYRPAPKHAPDRSYNSRYNDNSRSRNDRYNGNVYTRDDRYNHRYNTRYQGEGPDQGKGRRW